MNKTLCPACGDYYTTQATCPNCPTSTEAPQIVPNSVSPIMKETDTDKPKKLGKTGRKLNIPIVKYKQLIWYIRQTVKQAEKDKIGSYWLDGEWHSELEIWFWCKWKETGLPLPKPEYRFHTRLWKFDFCWPDNIMIAVEMEGGVYSGGRHTRGSGYKKDIEKYNEATRLGYRVYRFADMKQIHIDYMVERFNETLAGKELAA